MDETRGDKRGTLGLEKSTAGKAGKSKQSSPKGAEDKKSVVSSTTKKTAKKGKDK